MILIDFNQIALSSIFDLSNELNQLDDDETDTLKLIRHVVLNTLKYYKRTLSDESLRLFENEWLVKQVMIESENSIVSTVIFDFIFINNMVNPIKCVFIYEMISLQY